MPIPQQVAIRNPIPISKHCASRSGTTAGSSPLHHGTVQPEPCSSPVVRVPERDEMRDERRVIRIRHDNRRELHRNVCVCE